MSDRPHIFISYARVDAEIARRLRDALADRNMDVWIDVDALSVGQNWADEISRALRRAEAVVTLFSRASISSEWVRAELERALQVRLPVFPVLLGVDPSDLPVSAQVIQSIRVSDIPSDTELDKVADEIMRSLAGLVSGAPTRTKISAADLAPLVSAELTKATKPDVGTGASNSVFLVHGHNDAARNEVAAFLEQVGVRPIVLKDVPGTDQSLFQRFMRVAGEAQFAVVILSADDMGAALRQYRMEGVGAHALKFRARQNVILELGFFYGALGWDHVFGLLTDADVAYPDFERPSDLDGVLYDRIDGSGRWRQELRQRLERAGFKLAAVGS